MNQCQNYIDPDISQTPAESIIYTVDWTTRGLPDGLTIVSQAFTPSGSTDYTISNELIVDNGLQTAFQLTGGIPGTTYSITNTITLSDGETMQDTLIYQCVFQNLRRRSTCL